MSDAVMEGAAPQAASTGPAVAEISFEASAQEAIDAARAAHLRAVGPYRFLQLFPYSGAMIGFFIGLSLQPSIQAALFLFSPGLAIVFMGLGTAITAALAVTGFAMGLNLANRVFHRRYMLGMYERGMQARTQATFRVTDNALEATNGRLSYAARWPMIAELAATPSSWTVVVDMTTFVILKSAFADTTAERAFVAAILERLSPAARERSIEATAFVAEGVTAEAKEPVAA